MKVGPAMDGENYMGLNPLDADTLDLGAEEMICNMSLLELVALVKRAADEIELRMMEAAE